VTMALETERAELRCAQARASSPVCGATEPPASTTRRSGRAKLLANSRESAEVTTAKPGSALGNLGKRCTAMRPDRPGSRRFADPIRKCAAWRRVVPWRVQRRPRDEPQQARALRARRRRVEHAGELTALALRNEHARAGSSRPASVASSTSADCERSCSAAAREAGEWSGRRRTASTAPIMSTTASAATPRHSRVARPGRLPRAPRRQPSRSSPALAASCRRASQARDVIERDLARVEQREQSWRLCPRPQSEAGREQRRGSCTSAPAQVHAAKP
jgi:hypothetical protein